MAASVSVRFAFRNDDLPLIADERPLLEELKSHTEVFVLKHESMILGQWSYPSRKSQASSPWAKQHLTCSIMEKPHTGLDDCPRILLSCFRARNSGVNERLPGPAIHAKDDLGRVYVLWSYNVYMHSGFETVIC